MRTPSDPVKRARDSKSERKGESSAKVEERNELEASVISSEQSKFDLFITTDTITLRLLLAIVLAGFIAVVSIYSIKEASVANAVGVSTFYLPLVIIVLSVFYLGLWGVIATLLGAFISSLVLNFGFFFFLIWSGANVIEALMPLLAIKLFNVNVDFSKQRKEITISSEELMKRTAGYRDLSESYINLYFLSSKKFKTAFQGSSSDSIKITNKPFFSLFLLAIIPIISNLILRSSSHPAEKILPLGATISVLILGYLFVGSQNKNDMSVYLLIVVLLSSLIGALYGSTYLLLNNEITPQDFWKICIIWLSTNVMIITGYVTPILFYLSPHFVRSDLYVKGYLIKPNRLHQVRSEFFIFTFALILWIYAYILLYIFKWFGDAISIIHLFPFAVGSIYLSSNAYTALKGELPTKVLTSDHNKAFKEIENRVIVVEKNTESLLLVLSILIALPVSLSSSVPQKALMAVIWSATFACATIGIIWIPETQLIWIRVLKALKTTFHIYTISLLLLAAVMIIF